MDRLLTPAETAKLLGVEITTLAAWRHHSRYNLPYVKLGKKIMYRLDDVNNFIEQCLISNNSTVAPAYEFPNKPKYD